MLAHGGNLIQASQQFNIPIEDWIDLSTGINPMAYPTPTIPSKVWQQLPQEDDGLEQAAQAYYQTPHLLPVAGSQAAIQALPWLRPPSQVLLLRTLYQEHAHAWRNAGHALDYFDCTPTEQQLSRAEVIVLANPNNPTGQRFAPDTLLVWHQMLQSKQGWLIVDEAFMDATPEWSLTRLAGQDGLIILRSLGKFFGLAGARVGFLAAPPDLRHRMQEHLGPWTISGPSRLVAQQALRNHDWQTLARKELHTMSEAMQAIITSLGLSITGSTPYFHYVLTEEAHTRHRQLAQQGIWVRLFASPSALRVGLAHPALYPELQQRIRRIHS